MKCPAEGPHSSLPSRPWAPSAASRFGGGVFGEFLWGPYATAHYLKQFHLSYVSPEDLHRKVRKSQQEDWVGLMKLRNNYALNSELPVLMPWRTVQARDSSAWILERNPYFWEVDTEGNQLPYIDRWVLTKATALLDAIPRPDPRVRNRPRINWTGMEQSPERGPAMDPLSNLRFQA